MFSSLNKRYRTLNINEIRRRQSAKKATRLCILLIGETGAGKATFVNNLVNRKVFSTGNDINAEQTPTNGLSNGKINLVTERVCIHSEESSPLVLDIVLFPGCGDHINNSKTPEQIVGYLDAQFSTVFKEEIQIRRNLGDRDNRPHVCIYFVTATSRGLREFDIKLMQKLAKRINIIPVLPKSDLLTDEELKLNKNLIMRDITLNKINIFDFKEDKLEDSLMEIDDKEKFDHSSDSTAKICIKDMLPFSLICSDDKTISCNGQIQHIREYPWGNLIVEDPQNSDFIFLKSILLGSHLQEFKDITNHVIYEGYRTKMLLDQHSGRSPLKDETERPISVSNSNRRNAFSVPREAEGPTSDDVTVTCEKLVEKNKIIEEYKRKIESLEKRLKNSTDT